MNTLLNKVQYLYGISVVDVLLWCMLLTWAKVEEEEQIWVYSF